MHKVVFISLSAVLQLLTCGLFAYEAKTTPLGRPHCIKCGLAALVFLGMGLMLIWFLLVEAIPQVTTLA